MVGGSEELGQASERGSPDTIERAADVFLRALHSRLTVYFIFNVEPGPFQPVVFMATLWVCVNALCCQKLLRISQ